MWIGLDFGTTNSGAAYFDGDTVHHFALDPTGQDPVVMRSALYVTRDHQILVGREAVERYYRQNVGHPGRMVRKRVGKIEITQADVGSVKGYPTGPSTFVLDVYALVDELTPGRLLRSLKSGLGSSYQGTSIFDRFFSLEDLISHYLQIIRERVEAETDRSVAGVVLGRPVHFVGDAGDTRAEERLRAAAEAAGFPEIRFELEPVAAALHYELTLERPQNVVVFDLGGGTLDISVMRIGNSDQRELYASGGIGIAGDSFDQRILDARLLDHFGRNSTMQVGASGARIPFPGRYTEALLHWQSALELNKPETLRFLQGVRVTSSHPKGIRAFESLLVNNYVMRLYDQVEGAKIALSEETFALVQLSGDDIDLWQPVTRSQFESFIAGDRDLIRHCLTDTLDRSGLKPDDIDAVLRTGGSAQVPCLVEMLGEIFGAEKLVVADIFGSVAAGLAIRAWQSC